MSSLEIWCCEYQEVVYTLIKDSNDLNVLKSICDEENVSCIEVGTVRRDSILKVASIIQDDNYKMPEFIYLPQKDSDE